jgi:hypothetical protein
MTYSNEYLTHLAEVGCRSTGFDIIIAFDFYDGPESGLAILKSGDGFRFHSIGESKSRMHRAFWLVPIEGNWTEIVNKLPKTSTSQSHRVIVPSISSDIIDQITARTLSSPGDGSFVGVGSPYLDKLTIAPADERILVDIKSELNSSAAFNKIHAIIKLYRREIR